TALTLLRRPPLPTLLPYTTLFRSIGLFDGSLIVARTKGEVTANCDNEGANILALNLMHEIVTGIRTPQEARDFAKEEIAAFLMRSEEHTSELQSRENLVCRLLLEK